MLLMTRTPYELRVGAIQTSREDGRVRQVGKQVREPEGA